MTKLPNELKDKVHQTNRRRGNLPSSHLPIIAVLICIGLGFAALWHLGDPEFWDYAWITISIIAAAVILHPWKE